MKEPERIPLDPSTPKVKNVKTTPMPKLYPDNMYDDLFSSTSDKILNNQKNENHSEGDKT